VLLAARDRDQVARSHDQARVSNAWWNMLAPGNPLSARRQLWASRTRSFLTISAWAWVVPSSSSSMYKCTIRFAALSIAVQTMAEMPTSATVADVCAPRRLHHDPESDVIVGLTCEAGGRGDPVEARRMRRQRRFGRCPG
jgi:hypothetical protein